MRAAGQDPAVVLPPARQAPPGPVELLLRTFPACMGLVFGSYGEVSEAVHALESAFAVAIATREWRSMGARTESEARGLITTQLRRELSVATHAGGTRACSSRASPMWGSRTRGRARSATGARATTRASPSSSPRRPRGRGGARSERAAAVAERA